MVILEQIIKEQHYMHQQVYTKHIHVGLHKDGSGPMQRPQNLWDKLQLVFFQVRCPTCHPTNSTNALQHKEVTPSRINYILTYYMTPKGGTAVPLSHLHM